MDMQKIHWLGHASFRIEGSGVTLYIDPWKLSECPRADLVLITHEHFDHLSAQDIARVADDETAVVAPEPCVEGLTSVVAPGAVHVVAPGDELDLKGVHIRAVDAYNTEPDRQGFHPRDPGTPRVGYLFTLDGSTIYHTGDTDVIEEMDGLAPDLVLLPVGGTYTMTARQAARAAKRMRAAAAVPMHWGDIVGSREDAEQFAALFEGTTHIIDPE